MIEVPVKLKSGDTVFKFRAMSIEEAMEWSSKIKARMTYKEMVQRELELQDKVAIVDRDEDKYLALSDKVSKLDAQISEITKSLARFAEEPTKEKMLELMLSDTGVVCDALGSYLEKAFPTPEESKKS